MQRTTDTEASGSRSSSRRNSASSRRSSIKKDKERDKSATPKKTAKVANPEFVVTGKQLLKKSDRANSLPVYQRRQSDATKRSQCPDCSHSSRSRETSLEDDVSLDLSQVSDFEDTNSKYGIKKPPVATSTPKHPKNPPKNFQKPRSASLQSQLLQKMERKKLDSAKQSRDSIFSCSRDSLYKTSSSNSNRYGTELDYSSVSPEYSQSSTEMSPRMSTARDCVTDLHLSSCCVSTWQDCSEGATRVSRADTGEWSSFWANYNNSLATVPLKNYYDQCPTPYRTEDINLADLDFSDTSRKRSPDNIHNLNNIIRNEGLHLTPRETQNIIKCAHILGNVLSKAIERRSKEKNDDEEKIQELETPEPELQNKKKNLTLDLKETNIPLEVTEEKRSQEVTTQTDISLPNTKSAPKIFEKILKQLSRTSLDDSKDDKSEVKDVKGN